MARYRIENVVAKELSVPLQEPFVIASGRVDVTPNVLVSVTIVDEQGARATGYGEAATLHPVTKETQGAVLGAFATLETPENVLIPEEIDAFAADALKGSCARAGFTTAAVDALARIAGKPLQAYVGGSFVGSIATDITIPIADPGHMAKLAKRWKTRGFTCFKVKVGKDVEHDLRALELIHEAVPDATYRIDANAGFTAAEAIALAREVEHLGLQVECWEQPCGRLALDAMAEVAAALETPVIADESVATMADLDAVIRRRAADGINLKLVKTGGWMETHRLGMAAKKAGLKLMVGAMVETRLGIAAAAQLVAALGGVEFPDLDTALLLNGDPFSGGYSMDGSRLTLADAPGLGVEPR